MWHGLDLMVSVLCDLAVLLAPLQLPPCWLASPFPIRQGLEHGGQEAKYSLEKCFIWLAQHWDQILNVNIFWQSMCYCHIVANSPIDFIKMKVFEFVTILFCTSFCFFIIFFYFLTFTWFSMTLCALDLHPTNVLCDFFLAFTANRHLICLTPFAVLRKNLPIPFYINTSVRGAKYFVMSTMVHKCKVSIIIIIVIIWQHI